MLRTQIIDRVDGLVDIAEDWQGLFESTDANPYFSPAWLGTWIEHFAPAAGLRCCLVRDAEGPVGLVPLVAARQRLGHRVYGVAGGGWAMRTPCIVAERTTGGAVLGAVAMAMDEREAERWLYAEFQAVPRGTRLLAGTCAALPVRITGNRCSIVIKLPDQWLQYWHDRSRKLRGNVVRARNGLAREGDLELRRIGPGDLVAESSLRELLEDALEVSRLSWQASAPDGVAISDPSVEGFVRAASTAAMLVGLLDLSVLYVANRPVSFLWGAGRDDQSSISKAGYSSDFAKLSPGLVHLAMALEDSVRRGIRWIDFGPEFPSYKLRWGAHAEALVDLDLYSGCLPGRVVRWLHAGRTASNPTE